MNNEENKTPQKKSNITRQRILEAATKIFAKKSYNAASIRMIANKGGFDHGIIRYYYPSKALLFTAVSKKVCTEIFNEIPKWYTEVGPDMVISEGFTAYIDKFINYVFNNPDAFKIIMQNISSDGKNESAPGYEEMISLLASSRKFFVKSIKVTAPSEEIDMFVNCFNTIVFNYVGSSSSQARLIGMDPDSAEYQQWIKDTLTFMFLPRLLEMTDK